MKLINADCLKIISEMPENSVDHVFTSPPYNIGRSRSLDSKARGKYKHFSDNKDNYLDWCTEIIDQLLRITKGYVFWNIQANALNKADVFKLIGHYADVLEQNFIWYKPNATPSSKQYYVSNVVEYVLCFSEKKVKGNQHFLKNYIEINKGTKYIKDLNAQMPVSLSDHFITNYTQKDEVILDPFMGSGTTGVSCSNGQREFIGIELVQEYYEIAKERLT